jgi:hypothetical protein
MKKVLGVLLVFCLLAAMPFLLTACEEKGDGGAPSEGQLPTWEVGDTWGWSYVMQGETYTLTEEVIGEETVEGRDCYILDMSFDPVMSSTYDGTVSTITSMKYWGDKATGIYGVKTEMSGTYDGTDFTMTTISSYSSWASLFPLEIGKEIETERTDTQYFGDTQTGEPTVTIEKYRVDSKEDITVTSGTFSCWKIIIYDGDGNVTQTVWWSDEVKTMVKSADADGNTITELLWTALAYSAS